MLPVTDPSVCGLEGGGFRQVFLSSGEDTGALVGVESSALSAEGIFSSHCGCAPIVIVIGGVVTARTRACHLPATHLSNPFPQPYYKSNFESTMRLTFITEPGEAFVVEIDENMELESVMALLEAKVSSVHTHTLTASNTADCRHPCRYFWVL